MKALTPLDSNCPRIKASNWQMGNNQLSDEEHHRV